MKIEQAIKYLGCMSEHEELDTYLTSLGIVERPVFVENPMEWIIKEKEGFIFIFETHSFFEEYYGKVSGTGDMVFTSIRLYSSTNTSSILEYKSPLPFDLSFDKKIADVKTLLGTPAMDDEAPDDENRLCVWPKISVEGGYVQLSVVFLPKNGGITFMTISPVKLRYQ